MWDMRRGILPTVVAMVAVACAPSPQSAPSDAGDPTAAVASTTTQAPTITATEPELEPQAPRPTYQGFDAELDETTTLVAATTGETTVFDAPGSEAPLVTLDATTILGTGTVLSIVGEAPDGWLEVLLPVRPNDSTGWIHSSDVEIYVVEGKIIVDLSDRTLSYLVDGEEVLASTVAIGKSGYPTPTGSFFVTDSVTLADSGSPWGPHALGLSARSDTITEYNGGDGIIGIHGTNRPSSIGKAASLGCVRLPNETIIQLHSLVTIGTPVEIRA